MSRSACILIAYLLFLSYLTMPALVSASEAMDKNLSKCPKEDIKDARKHYSEEQANIARAAGKVVRKGLRLELRTRDRLVVITDDCTNGESYARYSFVSHIADSGFYLISVTGWEGHGFDLINDRNGEITKLEGNPVFSPNRKRFVTMSMDLEAGYNDNSIQIWQLDSAGPKLEYQTDAGAAWGPSDPVWTDNRTIAFKKNTLIEAGAKYQSSPALLIQKGNTWEIK